MSRCSVASRWPNGFGRSDVIAREISEPRRVLCARAGWRPGTPRGRRVRRFGRRLSGDFLRDDCWRARLEWLLIRRDGDAVSGIGAGEFCSHAFEAGAHRSTIGSAAASATPGLCDSNALAGSASGGLNPDAACTSATVIAGADDGSGDASADMRVVLLAKPVVDLGETADSREILRRKSQDVLEFLPRILQPARRRSRRGRA